MSLKNQPKGSSSVRKLPPLVKNESTPATLDKPTPKTER
jgi:hypothetical protein